MTEDKLNKLKGQILKDILNRIDFEDVVRDEMIENGVHPFSNEVTDTQVHTTFNELCQNVLYYLRCDYGDISDFTIKYPRMED